MALGQRLDLRQGQGLVITPQLQQAIKLLQMSNLEVEDVILAELEKNPLLVREDPGQEGSPEGSADSLGYGEGAEPADSGPQGGDPSDLVLGDNLEAGREAIDASNSDLYSEDGPSDAVQNASIDATEGNLVDWSQAGSGGGSGFDTLDETLERAITRDKTLHEYLIEQAHLDDFTAAELAIALILIDGVDEGGYLRLSLNELCERMGCDLTFVEAVLKRCQGFEPTGVMARSVPECLELQLRDKNRFDPAMAILLDNLELLARRDHAALKKLCGVDDDDFKDMIKDLKSLTPRPGAAFASIEPNPAVTPDAFVRPDPLGGWRVELNADTLPKVLVDQRYHAKVSSQARSDQEKAFLSDCLSQANWLVKSLDQRARTILKVSSEIVRQQDAFFAFGVQHLRPLNLKTVADAIGMHESTVSRVTSNKYVATPRGLFELKFFFTAAIASADGGEAYSAESVRHKIKSLIDQERAPADVLSDDRIVDILKEAGVDIARRTVAKYREALRIPSSVERRRALSPD